MRHRTIPPSRSDVRTPPSFVTDELHDCLGCGIAIHRTSSDLRYDPHFRCLFLDGLYAPDGDGKGQMFHPAPTQQDQTLGETDPLARWLAAATAGASPVWALLTHAPTAAEHSHQGRSCAITDWADSRTSALGSC